MFKVSKIFFYSSLVLFYSQQAFAFENVPLSEDNGKASGLVASGNLSGKKDELHLSTWGDSSISGFVYQYNNFMFGFQGSFGSDKSADTGASGDFTVRSNTAIEDKQLNRLVMGLNTSSGSSFYGFAGLAESFLSNSYDYRDASTVEGHTCQYSRWSRRTFCNSFKATQEAMGYAEEKDWYNGHVMGAGMQTPLLGGVLRLEYTYSDYGEITDKMQVTYRVNDMRIKANDPNYKDVTWDTKDHTAYVKWGVNF